MKIYGYVGVGGALGALSRYLIKIIPLEGIFGTFGGFPIQILVINVSGCFGLALFMAYFTNRYKLKKEVHTGIATGYFGAYTTFSTYNADVFKLLTNGAYLQAGIYVACSVILGLAGVFFAFWLASAYNKRFTSNTKLNKEFFDTP